MAAASRRAFPLVPRHRMSGVAYGTQRSLRKGQGAEIAGTRPYRPGDRLAWIDWYASARMSLVHDDDQFVVREYYAEVAPRVVIVVDRHPSMSLYPPELPWLSKPTVLQHAITAIVAAGIAARAYVGYIELARGPDGPSEHWIAPHRQGAPRILRRTGDVFHAPADNVELAVDYLLGLPQDVPAGTFVFVLSDFLHPPSRLAWSRASARRWDVVPVIVQDRTWEQTFPEVAGLLVPFGDPETGEVASVRLGAADVRERREANAARLAGLRRDFHRLQFDPVLLDTADPAAIDLAFVDWAARRARRRGRAR